MTMTVRTTQWRSTAIPPALRSANIHLHPGERIVAVGVGVPGMISFEGIVQTSDRVCIIGKKTDVWLMNDVIKNCSALPSVRGQCLSFRADRRTFRWYEVQPKSFPRQIKMFHKSGLIPQDWRHSTAKFLGGEFHGNQAVAAPAINDGKTVTLRSDGTSRLCLEYKQLQIAEYSLDDPCLSVDRAESVGRGIRTGRLAAVAAAAVLITPFALGAAPFATARRVKVDYALAIDDGRDAGLFAISDSSFGAWLTARRNHLVPTVEATYSPSQTATSVVNTQSPGSVTALQDDLARLRDLREQGNISDVEYERLRTAVVTSFQSGSPG